MKMHLDDIKDRLVSKGIAAKTIEIDRQFSVLSLMDNRLRIWVSDHSEIGSVSYDVDATVEYDPCNDIENLMNDICRAIDHIKTYDSVLKENGGELPIGWCY